MNLSLHNSQEYYGGDVGGGYEERRPESSFNSGHISTSLKCTFMFKMG